MCSHHLGAQETGNKPTVNGTVEHGAQRYQTHGEVHRRVVPDLDFLELFQGQGKLTQAMRRESWRCAGLDVCKSETQNILSAEGFRNHIFHIMRLRLFSCSFVHFGTVCSSWIWMCRDHSQRKDWHPEGADLKADIQKANIMVSRTAILMLLAAARGAYVMLEQPASSLMKDTLRMQEVFRALGFCKITTRMGCFGGETVKPSHLYGNCPCCWIFNAAVDAPETSVKD